MKTIHPHIAKATVEIEAPVHKVWNALVDPEIIRQYMFGAEVVSDWEVGSSIVWKGEWNGKPFKDSGRILEMVPNRHLLYTHTSISGSDGNDAGYHTIDIHLEEKDNKTKLLLEQDHNATEKAKAESEKNWKMMLEALKKVVEAGTS